MSVQRYSHGNPIGRDDSGNCTRSDIDDLELMRASLLLESDPGQAARRAGDILARVPGHTEASLLLATARRRLGDPAAAATVLEELARVQPESAFLQLELGRVYAASGQGAPALAALRRAVELDARFADAWRELAAQLFLAGETLEGDLADARYRSLSPERPELAAARSALAENRLQAGEAILRKHLERVPHDEVALAMLADAALRRDDPGEAERSLTRCLALAPGYAAARYELARLLFAQQRIPEMLPLLERLLAAQPANLDWMSLKAAALRLISRNDEAIALMEQTVAAHPHDDEAWLLFGHVLREVGEQSRAVEMFRKAAAVRPACGRAFSSLANLKTFRLGAADVEAIREQLARNDLEAQDRIHFEFALGKALEDAGDFAASFEHYERGNRLQRAALYYVPESASAELERQKQLYSAEFFNERSGWGSPRRDPIFIVGMPRSGSTLLEQMLASHPQVEGTRELVDIAAIAFELSGSNPSDYRQSVLALKRREAEALAERYLTRTAAYRSLARPHFVDKMLGNFCHVGFIHLLFPRAPIIDARRHPLGCGFSCYKQLFLRGQKFTYDLRELGRFYREYAALMDHFDAALPGRVHRVQYERLLSNPEAELRSLLAYCELPYDERCLRFHENPRVVQTISSEQVRQPLYTESVDQWRHYEPWLGPLKEALGDLIERYPSDRPAAG